MIRWGFFDGRLDWDSLSTYWIEHGSCIKHLE